MQKHPSSYMILVAASETTSWVLSSRTLEHCGLLHHELTLIRVNTSSQNPFGVRNNSSFLAIVQASKSNVLFQNGENRRRIVGVIRVEHQGAVWDQRVYVYQDIRLQMP